MTMTDFEKARELVIKIKQLEGKIFDLKILMKNDTSTWRMEIRSSTASSLNNINHYGMLPEFLQAVLSKHIEELHKLQSELDKL
jgi:hypothetical protein